VQSINGSTREADHFALRVRAPAQATNPTTCSTNILPSHLFAGPSGHDSSISVNIIEPTSIGSSFVVGPSPVIACLFASRCCPAALLKPGLITIAWNLCSSSAILDRLSRRLLKLLDGQERYRVHGRYVGGFSGGLKVSTQLAIFAKRVRGPYGQREKRSGMRSSHGRYLPQGRDKSQNGFDS
jgi:hypothetical protein